MTSLPIRLHGGKPIEILLVEDNVDEAEWTQQALRESKVRNRIHWVEDGEQAMAFLRREGPYAAAPRPDLILLDIYMPRKNGQEVLQEVKGDPELKRIPVVIMTSSDDEREILRAYEHHANCFVTKPIDIDKFMEVVRSIEDFWLTVVRLPAA
jgi:two-component system, chemotaxis family, response regulator Rcp1